MMSDQRSGPTRSGTLVLAVLVVAAAIAWVWVVIRQAADGTVFWPSVVASLVTVLVVGIGSWLVRRRAHALEQTDPEAAAQYRLQTRRVALALGASGVLLIGLVVIWLAL